MRVSIRLARKRLHDQYMRRNSAIDVLFEQACDDFDSIVALLIEKYRPKRIYQWGSLLDRKHFSEHSDIDIAVEGVSSAEAFFAMYGDAQDLTRFPLDLVQLEKIDPAHARSIIEKGYLVHERRD